MKKFPSVREAKEFLVSKITQEAQRESVPLSEVERKMMYFSETGWTLPDIWDVSGEFDRTCDQNEYEGKVAKLISKAVKRTRQEAPEEYETWWAAIRALAKGDHYLSVMIVRAGLRPPGDLLRLWGTAFAITVLLLVGIFVYAYLSAKYGVDLGRYKPSKGTIVLCVWAAFALPVIGYYLVRWVFGAQAADKALDKVMDKTLGRVFGSFTREDE